MRLSTLLVGAAAVVYPVAAATTTAADAATTAIPMPSAQPTLGQVVSQGCYSSSGDLTVGNKSDVFNSRGQCASVTCADYNVAAMTAGEECYCGDSYPPQDTMVDYSNCDIGCPGYPSDPCGGINYYSVFNTGKSLAVEFLPNTTDADASASSTGGTVVASSTVISGGQTSVVYVTQPASTSNSSDKSSSTNVGGIIAGVVVGVVVLLGIAGGIAFWWRKKVNREIEEEHRRNAAVNAFMKPPGSSGGYSIDTDARLDPVMAQRRMSSGSIADNEDYSRRILRVTNA